METVTWIRIVLALLLFVLGVRVGRALWLGRFRLGGTLVIRRERPLRYWTEPLFEAYAIALGLFVIARPRAAPLLTMTIVVPILAMELIETYRPPDGRTRAQQLRDSLLLAAVYLTAAFAAALLIFWFVTSGR